MLSEEPAGRVSWDTWAIALSGFQASKSTLSTEKPAQGTDVLIPQPSYGGSARQVYL